MIQVTLSVIVPIYNAELYIERCIESIINQTYKQLEIILVDDGSTDKSLSICQKYKKKDNRIKIIHKENGGLVSARKTGLLAATSSYITYVDSDDWIEGNMYAEMMERIFVTGADIVTSGCIRDYGNHVIVDNGRIQEGLYQRQELKEKVLSRLISTDIFYQDNLSPFLWNKIYRKELLMKFQMKVDNRITVGEDLACVFPCVINADKIVVLQRSYYHYCMHTDSMMGSKRYNNWESFQTLFRNLKIEMEKHIQEIPNIMKQYQLIQYYYTLLKHPEKIVYKCEDVLVPFGSVKENERVVIYGAGRFGCELKHLLVEKKLCNVIGWVDKKAGNDVASIETLSGLEFDKILIAVLKGDMSEQIIQEMKYRNIEEQKILTVKIESIDLLNKKEDTHV